MKIMKNMKYQRIKEIGTVILLLFGLAGCFKPEVDYNEMFGSPSAKIINNELIIKGGSSSVASASYVVPHAKIKENQIYVYGTLSFSKNNTEKRISLPKTKNAWSVYWVNKDYSLIEMQN
jgi:hypothetical protein